MVSPKLTRLPVITALSAMVLIAGCSWFGGGGDPNGPGETTPVPTPAQTSPGVTGDSITFGQSVDFGEIGTNLQIGIEAAFHEVNTGGGVNGRQFRLITLDDDYDPAKAIRNTERLINDDQVFALLASAGTPTGRAVLPITTEAGVPYVAPFTGAEYFREDAARNVVNLRASYSQEAEALVEFLVGRRGITRIGVMYQDDAYGRSGYSGVIEALRSRGMQPVAVGLYTANTNAIKTALLDLSPAHPQAVILMGTFEPVAALIEWARRTGLNTQFYTVSVAGNSRLPELLGSRGVGVYATQVLPLVTNDPAPVAASYENALRSYQADAEVNFYSFEGYLAGRLAIAGVSACGETVDRDCFLNALQNSSLLSIDGFLLRFGGNDNQGSEAVYLTVIGTDGLYHPVETLVESVS